VLEEREPVVQRSVVRTQIEELLEESSKVSRGVEVIQRIPVILTSESGPGDPEIEKSFRTEMVTSMTLPSLGGRHSLTASEKSAFVQMRSRSCNLPEKIVGSGVIEQIEALLFAVVKLHKLIASVYEQKGDFSTRGKRKTDQWCTGH